MAEQENNTQKPVDAQFLVQKVYVKDISFETPNSPEIFKMEWKPEVDIAVGILSYCKWYQSCH